DKNADSCSFPAANVKRVSPEIVLAVNSAAASSSLSDCLASPARLTAFALPRFTCANNPALKLTSSASLHHFGNESGGKLIAVNSSASGSFSVPPGAKMVPVKLVTLPKNSQIPNASGKTLFEVNIPKPDISGGCLSSAGLTLLPSTASPMK